MAVYDLEEQEQIAALRSWWKQYGGWATGVLLMVALACLGWYGWQSYLKTQNAEASRVFLVLQQASAQQDTGRVKQAAGELVNQYPRSQFAALGALLAATTLEAVGDAKSAEAQLSWVADNGKDAVRGVARLRLAACRWIRKSTTRRSRRYRNRHHRDLLRALMPRAGMSMWLRVNYQKRVPAMTRRSKTWKATLKT